MSRSGGLFTGLVDAGVCAGHAPSTDAVNKPQGPSVGAYEVGKLLKILASLGLVRHASLHQVCERSVR